MARSSAARHYCPLYECEANWTVCCEVQEVRECEMDAKWLAEPFVPEKADNMCAGCKWI